ncbi:MAG: lipid-A-disaccharide synthase [Burkholderiales bacterium]
MTTGDGPTIALVAGEASGDLIGGQILAVLRERLPTARFVGIGGPRMEAQGLDSWFPMERLAIRGYLEVIRHLPGLIAMRRDLKARILEARPAAFVGIDAPDFNFGLECGLRARGIPTVHLVSPSLWMWRGERIRKIRRAVDTMLCLFPFEPALYERAGVRASFIGHPLAELLEQVPNRAQAREQLRLKPGATVVALLPGSRQSEVTHLARPLVETAQRIARERPDTRFLVPLVTRETRLLFEQAIYDCDAHELSLSLLFGHAHTSLAAADVAVVASGTATLEAALLGCPMVIAYRMSTAALRALTLFRRPYLPYFGLPNILSGEFIVPELIQEDATPENLAQAALNLLADGGVRERLVERFAALRTSLKQDAAARAADAIASVVTAA